jgi:hypothetical protein
MNTKYYVLYQGSGGLVHMLDGLVYCCNWVNKRRYSKLIINVENHRAFLTRFGKFFNLINVNYSEEYDEILKYSFRRIPLSYIVKNNCDTNYIIEYNNRRINIHSGLNSYDQKLPLRIYAGYGKNNHKDVIKYVRVNNDTLNKLKLLKFNDNYIGVHFRNTDRVNNYDVYVKKLQQYINKRIYLATDDYKAYDYFKNKLPNHNIVRYTKPQDLGGKCLHFNCSDKERQVFNTLIDMYMLYNSTIFIDSPHSLVSQLVNTMREQKKSIFDE